MLHKLTSLLSYRACAGDDRFPITEGFLDPRTGALRFLAIDTGNWLAEIDVLISVREMGEVDPRREEWQSRLSRYDIAAAPRWVDRGDEINALSLEEWPKVVVGGFAEPVRRPDAGENIVAGPGVAGEPRATAPLRRNSKLTGLDPASDWIGLPAYGSDGRLGEVEDFMLDTETQLITHVLLARPALLSRRRFALPFSTLRYRAEGATHAVFDARAAEVAPAGPGLALPRRRPQPAAAAAST